MTGQTEIHFDAEPECPGFDACPAGRVNDNWFADTYRRDQAAISEMMAGG